MKRCDTTCIIYETVSATQVISESEYPFYICDCYPAVAYMPDSMGTSVTTMPDNLPPTSLLLVLPKSTLSCDPKLGCSVVPRRVDDRGVGALMFGHFLYDTLDRCREPFPR
jgi:hypothetical protein